MPSRITKITPAQIARFGEWAQRWIEIGLSTAPADFDKATAAALRAYELCNLKRPMVVLRMGSPYAATLGGTIAWMMLREIFGKKVGSQVWSQVGSQVWSQVGSQVGSQVWSQVWSQVGSQVGSQVWSQVGSRVWSQVGSQVGDAAYNYRGGSLWAAGWAAYVSFFRDVMGWEDPVLERFKIDEDLVASCGWIWWHENVLAISDRPSFIHRDDQGRLHAETGPAIGYRDGWAISCWHGTAVPPEWIADKTITPEIALTWENAEQRRAACEIVGWEKLLSGMGAKLIDQDPEPTIGELYEVNHPAIGGRGRFLRMYCPTGRWFAEPVPPEVKTALEANSWGWDLPPDIYKPSFQS